MARSSTKSLAAARGRGAAAAADVMSPRAGDPPVHGVASPASRGSKPLERLGPDTEGGTASMQLHRNAHNADQAPVDGLICTDYTLDVCMVCGCERVHTPQAQPSCPECGGSARRSFALFRGLREVER